MKKMEKPQPNFYKCMADDWSNFEKGKIYSRHLVEDHLYTYPMDWKPVMDYPTTNQLLETLTTGKNKASVLKALKQWNKQQPSL